MIGNIRRGEYARASSLLDYKIQSLIIKSIVEKELSNNKECKIHVDKN